MSRSRKKTPIMGNCGGSEKQDKRFNNRKVRRRNKIRIAKQEEPLDYNELTNPWSMSKDGKHWFGDYADHEDFEKWWRK